MKKQTAVEWLIERLGEYFPDEIGGIELLVKKAKEMEREQIINAADNNFNYINKGYITIGKLYYNENYGDNQ